MNETRREIKLEPDYKALFRTMLAELKNQGQPRSMFESANAKLDALRAVHRFIAPLAICSNSATTILEIEELRTVLADLSSEFCSFINELEAQAADVTYVCSYCAQDIERGGVSDADGYLYLTGEDHGYAETCNLCGKRKAAWKASHKPSRWRPAFTPPSDMKKGLL